MSNGVKENLCRQIGKLVVKNLVWMNYEQNALCSNQLSSCLIERFLKALISMARTFVCGAVLILHKELTLNSKKEIMKNKASFTVNDRICNFTLQ